ncbi:glycosyltransferase [Actinokineospora bangkokensis]|uniref:Glycosyl transferase n=1 Tax=Actinokineospora bangkokensis TaxID=1193682 RepID=A0A1Q9LLM0_9PSEU|nr:glycosyltransferase [Actinokineospora bangkokensis]OLR92937.1 hypothetical protein BJP25_18360 [Actinokineospora bangkokensis]
MPTAPGAPAIAMVSYNATPDRGSDTAVGDEQARHVAELAAGLSALGFAVTTFTRRASRREPERSTSPGGGTVVRLTAGPVRPLNTAELLTHLGEFTDRLTTHLRSGGFAAAHAHHWTSGVAAALAARSLPTRVLVTHHAFAGAGRGEHAPLERRVALTADRVLATSAAEVDHLVGLGVPRTSVSVVPGGVDIGVFTIPDGQPHAKTGQLLVAPAPLVRGQGVDTAIAVLPRLPDVRLVVAGHGPDETRLRAAAARLGVLDRVRFTGAVTRAELAELFRAADLVLRGPAQDPHGALALQASACGAPVLASPVGALADVVVDGITGRHVRPGSAAALHAALRDLLADPHRLAGMGLAGADRAASRYSWARVAAEVSRAYRGPAEHPTEAALGTGTTAEPAAEESCP